jgi:hypothetical protein
MGDNGIGFGLLAYALQRILKATPGLALSS